MNVFPPFCAIEQSLVTKQASNKHRRTGRGGRGGLQPPQNLGNSDILGSERKFGQSQFLKTSPFYLIILKKIIVIFNYFKENNSNNPFTLQWLLSM